MQAKRSKNSDALSFSGLGRAGRGETPFSFAQTRDSKNLENIRENTTLKNRESTESSADSESGADSKTITESNAEILKDAQLIESSHIDSGTITESKEILKNEKTQNLGGAESKFSLDSVFSLEKVLRTGHFSLIFAPQKWRNFAIVLGLRYRTPLFTFSKASRKFFEVVDCVSCLDS